MIFFNKISKYLFDVNWLILNNLGENQSAEGGKAQIIWATQIIFAIFFWHFQN